jgi:exopolysaccharide production protein ExoZ
MDYVGDNNHTKRIVSLDYLRGLMAFSILVYHYASWYGEVDFSSATVLGRLGIYGVEIFYIISGLSLALVYKARLNDIRSLASFFIKRFFRIAPIFWFVTTIVLAIFAVQGKLHHYSIWDIILIIAYCLVF